MTSRQIALVQGSWKDVLAVAETAAQLFYLRLFALDESLRPMFKGELREQGRKLIAMMSVAVNGLARIETLVPVIEALGRRHAGYGVKDEHYATVAAALLWALEQGLGPRFTPDVKDAWTAAYGLLAATMQGAARDEARAAQASIT
jgi:hemoglobin-like flavoprotein